MARKKRSSYRDSAPAAAACTYRLEDAPSDWVNWARPIQWYLDNRLVPIDHWREERTPEERGEDPWVEVLDEDDNNTVYQVVASMILPSIRKTRSLLDTKKVILAFPPLLNPDATDDDLDLAGLALTDIRQRSFDGQVGNSFGEMIELTMARGTYFEQSELTVNLPKDAYRGDCPIRHTLHDLFDVRWDIGPDLNVKRIILRKTVTWGMLSQEYRDAIDLDHSPHGDRGLPVFEYWDDTHHGILINGKVAKPLAPHGYPRCPFTVGMHQPSKVRQGQQPPRTGQRQPWTAYYVGRPVCEDLLGPSEFDSRLMTAMFENVKRTSITPLAGKGLQLAEGEDVIDAVNSGFIALEDSVTSQVQYVAVPDGVSNGLRLKAEHDKRQTDTAGASPDQFSGVTKDRTSTAAASDMTSWTRAAAEAVRTTVAEQMRRHTMLDAEILATRFPPSDHRKMLREDPETLAMLGDALSLDKESSDPYPSYRRLSGSEDRVIDGDTFKYLVECEVRIPPVQLFDVATGHNVGLQIWNLPPEKSLLSRRTVLADYLMVPDVDAEIREVLADEMMADPTSPVGKLMRAQAWVRANAAELGDQYVAEVDGDFEKAIAQAMKQYIQQIVTQAMPAPNLPANSALVGAGAAPPPGGGPPNMPPPGGPGGPGTPPPIPMPQGGPGAGVPMAGGPPPMGAPPGGPPPLAMPAAPPGLMPNGFPPQGLQ